MHRARIDNPTRICLLYGGSRGTCSYVKKNLWGPTERAYLRSSKDAPHQVISTPLGPVGLLVCWDLAFPEAWRELVSQGAKIIIVPTLWTRSGASEAGHRQNPSAPSLFLDSILTARTFENTCAVVFANAGGPPGRNYCGLSQINIPYAGPLVRLGTSAEGMGMATVDMAVLEDAEENYAIRSDLTEPSWHYRHTRRVPHMETKQLEQPQSAETAAPAPAPPNGGLAAWSGVFASFLLFLSTWGFSTAFGAFQSYYQSDLLHTLSPSSIAWVGTVNAFFLISTGVIAGPLFDRGYLHHLMIAGCFLTTFGLMMLSLATQYYQVFLSQGLCCGLGSGLIYVPALSLVSTQFTTRRGIAIGLVTSGASVGGVIFPIIFIRLQPHVGFPWTVRTLGFIQLACSCIAVPLLMVTTKTRRGPPRQLIHWHAMKEWSFNAYGIANFLMFMAYFIPLFYVPAFASTALRTSTDLSFYMVSILNAGSAIGRIGSSLLTYRLGASHILLASVIASAVLLFGWIGIHSVASFVVFCVLFGIFSGVLISANPLVIAHPVVSPTPSVIGTRMGMQWFATSLGVLIGAPIAGVLEGHGGDNGFLALQIFSGAGMTVGAAFLLVPMMAVWRHDRTQNKA
ncbi:hypothetical protein CNMCM6457_001804 [Aspergillus fumigatiaffinis]|nr:hypothetical protein CNMCM6457_001804 [Aspergillus fumigatiaffinis]